MLFERYLTTSCPLASSSKVYVDTSSNKVGLILLDYRPLLQFIGQDCRYGMTAKLFFWQYPQAILRNKIYMAWPAKIISVSHDQYYASVKYFLILVCHRCHSRWVNCCNNLTSFGSWCFIYDSCRRQQCIGNFCLIIFLSWKNRNCLEC